MPWDEYEALRATWAAEDNDREARRAERKAVLQTRFDALSERCRAEGVTLRGGKTWMPGQIDRDHADARVGISIGDLEKLLDRLEDAEGFAFPAPPPHCR